MTDVCKKMTVYLKRNLAKDLPDGIDAKDVNLDLIVVSAYSMYFIETFLIVIAWCKFHNGRSIKCNLWCRF